MAVATGSRQATSLEALIGYFALALRSEGKRPKTLRYYIGHLKLFLSYARAQGWQDIGDIDAWAIRQFLAYVREPSNPLGRKQPPETSREESRAFNHWRALTALFGFLRRERLILEDPLENIRLPRPAPQNLSVYSREEIERINRLCLLDFRIAPTKKSRAVAARNHALFLVALDTGLRLSELAGVQAEDVDPEGGVIKVRRRKGGKSGMVRVGMDRSLPPLPGPGAEIRVVPQKGYGGLPNAPT